MARLLVLYEMPTDPAAFDRYYADKHIPLARKIPGLRRFEVSNGTIGSPPGTGRIYKIATLHFDSLDALDAGLRSSEGHAAADDLVNFTDGGAELYIFETTDV